MPVTHEEQQRMRQEAATWAVRLAEDEPSAKLLEELQRWLSVDRRRPDALREARRHWVELRSQAASPSSYAFPVEDRLPSASSRPHRGRWLAAAAVLCIAILGVLKGPEMLLALRADELTAVGEVRRVSLPDGSVAELDSRSALALAYNDRERRVRLLNGEAYFEVAPLTGQEPRPFIVESAGGEAQALGTRFVVGERGSETWVGVLEHSVAVSLQQPVAFGDSRLVLQEGQSARYEAGRGLRRGVQPDLAQATGWRRGLLVFEKQPLADVVQRIGRYRSGRILVADSTLANRRVSGVLHLNDLDRGLDMLVAELGARSLDLPGLTLIR